MRNIAGLLGLAMFFSCTNSVQEIQDLFETQNLPIGHSSNVSFVYKDSGRVSTRMITPLRLDFSNRSIDPYSEFPQGVIIKRYDFQTGDSIRVEGDYAITYDMTKFSYLKGNVKVVNYQDGSMLETDELFWDQDSGFIFTEKNFTLTQGNKIVNGQGFESNQKISNWLMRNIYGQSYVDDEQIQ